MSHESEIRRLYGTDPHVSDSLFGRMIEEAQDRDRREDDLAELPEPDTEPERLTLKPVLEPAMRRAAAMFGAATAEQVGDAMLARARRLHDDDPIACPSCGTPDVIHVPGSPLCRPADDATPEAVARFVLKQFEHVIATLDTVGLAIEGLNSLDTIRRDDVAAAVSRIEQLEDRMALRASIESALARRLDGLRRTLDARTEDRA